MTAASFARLKKAATKKEKPITLAQNSHMYMKRRVDEVMGRNEFEITHDTMMAMMVKDI